jgi:hypothetical protein
MYFPISDTLTINVLKINQSNLKIIVKDAEQDSLGNIIIKVNRNNKYELSISGAIENPNCIFNIINTSSINNDICKIDKNMITPYSGGTCLIEGICNETTNYLQTKAPSILVRVIRTEQNDLNLVNDIVPPIYYNNQTYLDISGGNTKAQLNIDTDSSNCKITDNNTILGILPGNCTINVVKPGDYFYYDKIKQFNFEVLKMNQPPIHIILENKEYDYIATHSEPNDFKSNILELNNFIDNNSYKNGTYIINASSFIVGYEPYLGFTTNNSGWQSNKNTYDNLGNYLGKIKTKINGIGDIFGEWLEITLPYFIKLTQYKLINTTLESGKFCPKLYYVVGSNDNIIWYNIDYKNLTNIPITSQISTYVILNNNFYFKRYRIVINKNFGSNSVILNQFDFIGIYSNMTYTLNEDKNISYNVILNNIQDNASYNLSITNTYSLDPNNSIIKINTNNTITPYNSGVCLLMATINSTNNYNLSNTIPIIIIVNKKEQELIIKGFIPPLYYNSKINIDISSSTTDNVYLTSNTLETCTVSGYTLIGKKAGKCQITITKPGDNKSATQNLQVNLQVNKLSQPKMFITIAEVNESIKDNITLYVNRNKSYKLNLIGYQENPLITYSIITNYSLEPSQDVCKITSNNELIAFNLGVCLLRANVSETNNYLYAQSEPIVISVFKNKQSELNYKANQLIYTNKINLDISGGSIVSPVTLSVNDDSKTNCSISSNEVTGLFTGKCNISAIKQGDYNYDDTQITIPLVVNKKNQPNLTISIANLKK